MDALELMQRIRRLEIKARGLSRHIFSGDNKSAYKGRGMAFSEVRNYNFGDEVRTIDWNVTARFNDPYVKVFEEEKELTVMLILDISGSAQFGSTNRSKADVLIETAATLAYTAMLRNDKVGALFITDRVEKYIEPQKGKRHTLYILRELLTIQPKSTKTDLSVGLKYFRNLQKRRSTCFVISDFIDSNNVVEGMRVINSNHDVIALKLEDPFEAELPKMGFLQLFNAETGETTWVNTNDQKVREQFAKDYHDQQEQMTEEFRKVGIDYAVLDTSEEFLNPLIQLLHKRR